MNPGLYLVGTPIGNLEDITLRALATLKSVQVILAEDTRHTRRLLDRHGIATPLVSCHKFNEAARLESVLARIQAGEAVALVTDSGMPCVSDPGARVVAGCRRAGLPVTVVPGPSAVTAAAALCGWVESAFCFEGFLSHKSAARKRRLAELAGCAVPVILFESPYRLFKLLDEIEEVLGPRPVFVGRELTKHFEECRAGTPAEILQAYAGRSVKGELTVVIAPAGRERKPAEGDDSSAPQAAGASDLPGR